MDQKTITEALQKALVHGSGSLDDLAALLKRAQADVEQAKKDQEREIQEAAAKKRGEEVAALANRMLEGKTTDEDAAEVLNIWLNARGLKGKPFTAASMQEIFELASDSKPNNKSTKSEIDNALDQFINQLDKLAEEINSKYNNKKPAAKPKADPDDVINDFLRSMGLK